ncbi:MAG: DNA repair protein RecO [Thermodesulfobacteriota bacterium]|nr:DNA repair protein RecO [Thermodesulfobacteriota bacterium]
MSRFSCDAIILNTIDFMESDRIVHALTKQRGLIHAIAKGAKRSSVRFPGTLEPFCEVRMEVFCRKGMDLLRLETASLKQANLGLREDLDLFAHASVLLELVMNNVGTMDPCPETFECLRFALTSMEKTQQWFSLWSISILDLLSTMGYALDMGAVPSLKKGLGAESLMFLEKGRHLGPEILPRLSIGTRSKKEVEIYLLSLCNQISEKPLKSVDFISKLTGLDLHVHKRRHY